MLSAWTNVHAGESRSHIARQKFRAIDALYAVPDARRVYHFINVELRGAERLARDLVHLNVDDGRLNKASRTGGKRIDSMTRMFETLSERTRPPPPPLKRRQGPGAPTHRSSHDGSSSKTGRAIIARLQKDGGLKGTDIANFTGVSKATVSRWGQRPEVAGIRRPS